MAIGLGVNIQKQPNKAPTGALGEAIVNGSYPKLLLDFNDDYYATNGGKKLLGEALTHSRSGNATMVDSDGLIKWAPHNLQTDSQDFSGASWSTTNTTVTANAADAPDGTATADKIEQTASGDWRIASLNSVVDADYTYGVFLKTVSGTGSIGIRIYDGASFSDTLCSVTEEWQLFTVSSSGTTQNIYIDSRVSGSTLTEVYAWGAHLYRSDLGGMVDNPDRGDSYVPTTSSAVYLPRRGHHVYNGSAWVNEGLLHESEARTNLVAYSEALSNWNLANAAGRLAVIDNQSTGPDGETSLSRIQLNDNTSGGKIISNEIAYTSGDQVTISCYFKPDEYTTFAIGLGDGANNWARAVFDTSTVSSTKQSVGASSGTVHDYGITALSGNLYYAWAKVSVTEDGDSLASVAFMITNSATPIFNIYGANVYAGTAGEGAYAGFIQAETAPTPSSYIPTAGATVTRAAETLTIPSANLPYSSTAMSMAVEGRVTYADTDNNSEAIAVNWNQGSSNYWAISLSALSTRTGDFRFAFRSNAGSTESLYSTSNYTPGILVPFNVAVRASGATNYINIAADGVAVTQEAYSGTGMPALQSADLDLGYDYMGTIKTFRIWDKDLGDTGIEEASS